MELIYFNLDVSMISIFIYLELAKYKLSSIFEFSFLVAALMFSYNI